MQTCNSYLIFIILTECRYDVALGVNTLGAKHVVNFAKNCAKIELLIHVSTGKSESILLYYINPFNFGIHPFNNCGWIS